MMKRTICVLLVCLLLLGIMPMQVAATEKDDSQSITFALLADLHYKDGMYISSVADLNSILQRANDADADFVMQLGDFSNDWSGSPELTGAYLQNSYGLPAYGVYGNHELESNNSMAYVTPKLNNREVVWGTADGTVGDGSIAYYYYDVGSFRIVCTDSNYSYNPTSGAWEHNVTGSYGAPSGNIKENSFGPEQLAWVEEVLTNAAHQSKHCIFFSHASVSGVWSSSPDTVAVQAIFARVNAIQKGTVLMAVNGHLHTNHTEVRAGVFYLDLNTVRNGAWVGDQKTHHYTDETFAKVSYDSNGTPTGTSSENLTSLSQAKNTWFFEDPLSAVVTVSTDGKITLDGSSTGWLGGIEPSVASGTSTGVTPQISSGEFQVGTQTGAVQIATAADLKRIGKDAAYPLDGLYELTADIDLGGEEWTPIGSVVNDDMANAFSGVFNGNGHTVSNFKLTITDTSIASGRYGFFGSINGGVVKDLTIANATYTSSSSSMGSLGAITGRLYAGIVSGCETAADVSIAVSNGVYNNRNGGIVGYCNSGLIEYCANRASISATTATQHYNGGIAGGISGGTLQYCINYGNVSSTATVGYLGGVCGQMDNWTNNTSVLLANCINLGTVTSGGYAGGLVGHCKGAKPRYLNHSYNLGEVSGTVANAQILAQIESNPTGGAGNYGTTAVNAPLINGMLDGVASLVTTEAIQAQAVYRNIVASVSAKRNGASTNLYGYQTKAVENGTFDMRLVATLSGDIEHLQNVGFEVSATYTGMSGKRETVQVITKLYRGITATSVEGGDILSKTYTAESLGGDYIFVLACKGLPANAQNITFTVTTFYTEKGAPHSVFGSVKTFTVDVPSDTLHS